VPSIASQQWIRLPAARAHARAEAALALLTFQRSATRECDQRGPVAQWRVWQAKPRSRPDGQGRKCRNSRRWVPPVPVIRRPYPGRLKFPHQKMPVRAYLMPNRYRCYENAQTTGSIAARVRKAHTNPQFSDWPEPSASIKALEADYTHLTQPYYGHIRQIPPEEISRMFKCFQVPG
jgi:hypothetical protein